MPYFKVVLAPDRNKPGKNPFDPVRIPVDEQVKLRVWERVHAKDEGEIRGHFAEAKKESLPHVRGHSIHSIERLPS